MCDSRPRRAAPPLGGPRVVCVRLAVLRRPSPPFPRTTRWCSRRRSARPRRAGARRLQAAHAANPPMISRRRSRSRGPRSSSGAARATRVWRAGHGARAPAAEEEPPLGVLLPMPGAAEPPRVRRRKGDAGARLERDPRNPQAWFTRAVVELVLMIRARPRAARTCARIDPLWPGGCASQALSRSAVRARATTRSTPSSRPHASRQRPAGGSSRAWRDGRAAGRCRCGRRTRSQGGRTLDPDDVAARADLADLLLDVPRCRGARLRRRVTSRRPILRLALADTRSATRRARHTRGRSRSAEEARLRGASVHAREEARARARRARRREAALELARANFGSA
jgi:hypothetical protein